MAAFVESSKMCLVLYLASDKLIQPIIWDETSPSFYVAPEDPDARNATQHLSKSNMAYVGSDNGCGCGFRQEHDAMIDDPQQLASKADNQNRLHDYIAACLVDQESVELYSCWSGEETLPMEHDRRIRLSELVSGGFVFLERQRTVVIANPK